MREKAAEFLSGRPIVRGHWSTNGSRLPPINQYPSQLLFQLVPSNILLRLFWDRDLLLWEYHGITSRICPFFHASKNSGLGIIASACDFLSDSPSFLLPHRLQRLLQLLGELGVMQVVKFNSSSLIWTVFRQRSVEFISVSPWAMTKLVLPWFCTIITSVKVPKTIELLQDFSFFAVKVLWPKYFRVDHPTLLRKRWNITFFRTWEWWEGRSYSYCVVKSDQNAGGVYSIYFSGVSDFLSAVAYHFCLHMPEKFSQPMAHFLPLPRNIIGFDWSIHLMMNSLILMHILYSLTLLRLKTL